MLLFLLKMFWESSVHAQMSGNCCELALFSLFQSTVCADVPTAWDVLLPRSIFPQPFTSLSGYGAMFLITHTNMKLRLKGNLRCPILSPFTRLPNLFIYIDLLCWGWNLQPPASILPLTRIPAIYPTFHMLYLLYKLLHKPEIRDFQSFFIFYSLWQSVG